MTFHFLSRRRHEGISYGFDKKFVRTGEENGGYDAGSNLADHALDDYADASSGYTRRLGDHSARAANADKQSADRFNGFGNNAWKNAVSPNIYRLVFFTMK